MLFAVMGAGNESFSRQPECGVKLAIGLRRDIVGTDPDKVTANKTAFNKTALGRF